MTVIKIIELVGVSTKGLQDALENVVKEASKTIRNMKGVDILSWTAKIEDDKIVEYRSNVKISFVVKGER